MSRSITFHDQFHPIPDNGLSCGAGRTCAEFAKECDINNIIRQYETTGVVGGFASSEGTFGDFSNIPDLITARQQLNEAEAEFMRLSSKVRARFNNDPLQLLDFISHEENRQEAVSLGLISESVTSQDAQPTKVAPVPSPILDNISTGDTTPLKSE